MKIKVNLPKIELPIPSIVIWHVMLTDKKDGFPLDDHYFLFLWRARRFMEKNYKKADELDCHIGMGGETLWFW